MSDTTATATAQVDSAPAGNDTPAENESYEAYRAQRTGVPASEPASTDEPETPAVPAKPEPPAQPAARKPYQNAVPPERVEAMVTARDRRIAELETEVRLAREGRLQPAPAQPEPAAPAKLTEPDPQDFNSEAGFDSKGYGRAVAAFARQEALEAIQEQQTQAAEAQQQQEFVRHVEETRNNWLAEAQPLADADPEIAQSLSFLGSEAVLRAVPRAVTMELLQAHPLVGHLIASDQRLFDIYKSGDVLAATKLIARIDTRVQHELAVRAQAPAPGAPTQQEQEQQELRVPVRQPNSATPPRNTSGQFQSQATGLSDVDAGPSSGSSNDSYAKYRAERLKRERGI